MAYRRAVCIRANLLARRPQTSFVHVSQSDEDLKDGSLDKSLCQDISNSFIQRRSFVSNPNYSSGLGSFFPGRRYSNLGCIPSVGSSYSRYMSTAVGDGAENIELISDVAGVISDTTVQAAASQAPAVNEVAIAAADSFYPVMGLQYLIDYVHTFTGLNWWAAIALTTFLIRGATVPFLINTMKATAKLAIIRPRMEEIKDEMQSKAMDPRAVAEGQRKMKQLFTEHGVSPFSPMKGLFIQGPIFVSFFFAVSNMAEKVSSFKSGGAYWFVDLTTRDDLYIFPILTGLTFLITVECNMQEGMEGNAAAGVIKNLSRGLAVLTVPFTASFPKAIFCYWISSNIFSLAYGLAIKRPGVKKFLGIPDMPKPPPSAKQSEFSFFDALKKYKSAQESKSTVAVEPSPFAGRKTSSSAVLRQRLMTLEKEVKGRKKNKRR